MDKKNVVIGVILLLAGLGLMIWTSGQEAEARREAAEQAARQQAESPAVESSSGEENGFGVAPAGTARTAAFTAPEAAAADLARAVLPPTPPPGERVTVLENDYMIVAFSNLGGAVKSVTLKHYAEEQGSEERVVMHRLARIAPLSLARASGNEFLPISVEYDLVESTDERVVYETRLPAGVVVRRVYEIDRAAEEGPGNYSIHHRLEFSNPTDTAFSFDNVHVNIGTAEPTGADPYGFDLNASSREDGSYDNIPVSKFKGGFFSSARDRVVRDGIIEWGAVKNQFFTSILTPADPAQRIVALPVEFPRPMEARDAPLGVTAYLDFALPTVEAGGTVALTMDYYSGPKDFQRLSRMEQEQEDVMHLGWFMFFFIGIFAFFGKLLLSLLTTLHGWVGNWGWAIILMTLVVRLLLWPLTAKAARASKRMQELSKPMQEIKEKYKDNPQKQQQETIELFKKHKVNPLSGCWPVLLQFPIFIAMFNLLRNTADLRFAHWLWIDDLSMPDATIPLGTTLPLIGAAINVLPFVWLASMYYQMKMMPQPSVDNAQVKIIKFMPFIFFPFTYIFSSGLVLYWTTTNCFSIFQAWVTKRKRDAEDIAIEAEIAESEKKKGPIQTKPLGKKKKKKEGPRR